MANINFFRNAAKPIPEATKDKALQKEGVELYDSGKTESIESPDINIRKMPQEPFGSTADSVSPGSDEKYGFVEKDIFDLNHYL